MEKKKSIEKNVADREEELNQIDKGMVEFSKEKAAPNTNKERIKVTLIN